MVPRPVARAQGATASASIPFGGHETAREFRENIEAPFFRYYLHGKGEKPTWQATTFQSGSNRWRTYAAWPPREAEADQPLPARRRHAVVRRAQAAPGRAAYREYVSDPANPGALPAAPDLADLSRPATGGRWEVADQRFVDDRPDVLTLHERAARSRPDDHRRSGGRTLFASTSGTDADFVVKLIDVYPENAQAERVEAEDEGPEPGQYARSLNGYELPIAMEVRRGRYNTSYEQPRPLAAEYADRVEDPACAITTTSS